MSNLRQAAQQALEALENDAMQRTYAGGVRITNAAIALRAALAEPEQNPFGDDAERYARKLHEEREAYKALFTEHKSQTTHWEGCEAVHPECKAKPITAAEMSAWVKDTWEKCQAEAWQEPVAWAVYDILHGGSKTLHWPEQHSPNGDPKQYKAVPLYTAPTPRKPLTDEGIRGLADKHLFYQPEGYEVSGIFNFARAIERAHGIGERHE